MSFTPQQPSFIHTRAVQMQAVDRFPLAEDAFTRLRDQLAQYCGVYLDSTRQHLLEQAIAYRLQIRQCSFAVYEQRIRVEREELRQLSELVVNHETSFFRNQPHMRALRDVLLPELHRRKPRNEPIRMWSAGCATGEEAYSLAITALEALPFNQRPVEVWATDLSEAALATAQAGVYAGRTLTNVSPHTLAQYFEPTGASYRVRDRVRQCVRFQQVNLLEPLPQAVREIDIVFCQNVIIYFELATSRAFLRQLQNFLPNNAMLCLGFSETLWNMVDGFHTREVLGSYVYYKEAFSARGTAPLGTGTLQQRTIEAAATTSVRRPQRVTRPLVDRPTLPPTNVQERVLAAREYANRGQIHSAIDAATQALKYEPLHEEAALLLGVLYAQQGEWEDAVQQLERARYLNSASPLISFQLAEAYRGANRSQAALREYRSALAKLQPYPPGTIIDGVTVGWLHETCQRHISQAQTGNEKGR